MEKEKFGFGYSVYILCVGQTNKTINIPGNTNILFANHEFNKLQGFRGLICDSEGQLYDLSSRHELGGVFFVKENENFDKGDQTHYFSFPWMNQEEINEIKYLKFEESYIDSFESILKFLMEQSPTKKLYVYFRCQSLDMNNIIGTLSVKRFLKIIKSGLLLGNITYVLSDTADMDLNKLINDGIEFCDYSREYRQAVCDLL